MTLTVLFGGTFDPVHLGHLCNAREIAASMGARVILVPSRIPPHRPQPVASAEQRLAMLRLAVQDYPELEVDDCELKRSGTSYTVDTLRSYRERLGDAASLVFALGIDAYLTLPAWERWQSLTSFAHLLVLGRPGGSKQSSTELDTWARPQISSDVAVMTRHPAGSIVHVQLAQMDVSASLVRQRLASGQDVSGMVPEAVIRYIADRPLYLQSASTY